MSVDLFFLFPFSFWFHVWLHLFCGVLWLVADWGEVDGSRC